MGRINYGRVRLPHRCGPLFLEGVRRRWPEVDKLSRLRVRPGH